MDLSKLYTSDNTIDENADMRLKYLQAQADAEPDELSLYSIVADRIKSLVYDLYQFISQLGTLPVESIPHTIYMTLQKGDNMFVCGIILAAIGLLGVAFSSESNSDITRV